MDGGMAGAVVDGQMDLKLGGETVVLTANLFAGRAICRHFGGVQAALNRVAAGDIEAFIVIVRAGLGIKADADAKAQDIDERVFRGGILSLTSPLTEFLLSVANGGRPVGGAEPEAAGPPGKGDS
jgi:hypothetical protein